MCSINAAKVWFLNSLLPSWENGRNLGSLFLIPCALCMGLFFYVERVGNLPSVTNAKNQKLIL